MSASPVVLVTNVLHYVGPGAVARLQRDGARLAVHDRSFAEPAARQAYAAAHPEITALAEQAPTALVAAALAGHGRLDAVVSNDDHPAVRAPLEAVDLDTFRAGLEAMLVQPLALAQAAVPAMKRQGGGRIILVTSAAPLRGLANYGMYAAARGGANALALTLAKELAPHNILVNAVAPNYVENPSYFPPALLADPAARAKMEKNIPLRRLGKPEEVGALIAFLAIGDCGFITGHVVPVAGGWA